MTGRIAAAMGQRMSSARRRTYADFSARQLVAAAVVIGLLAGTFLDCLSHGAHPVATGPGPDIVRAAEADQSATSAPATHNVAGHHMASHKPCHSADQSNSEPHDLPADPHTSDTDCACCSLVHCFSCLVPEQLGVTLAWTDSGAPQLRSTLGHSSLADRLERPPKQFA